MRAIDLWDLAQERKIYVKIKEPLRGRFFRYLFKSYGSIYKFAKILDIHPRQLWAYRKGERSTSLVFLNKLLKLCPEDTIRQNFIKSIKKNIEILKYGWNGKCIKNPKLPIEFSKTLCRIIGHIVGDGGIRYKYDFTTQYANKNRDLVGKFKKDVIKVFGEVKPYDYYNKEKGAFIVLFPSIIGYILTMLFGRQTKEYKHVPKLVLKSNKEYKAAFLSAVFDDEACVNLSAQRIELEMCGKELISDIKKLLKEFGIKTRKIHKTKDKEKWRPRYRIIMGGKINFQKFSQSIGFTDKDKKEKLELLLKRYDQRLNATELRNKILKILKKNGEMSFLDLTKVLPYSGLKYNLKNLEKEGLINSKLIKGGQKGVQKIFSFNSKYKTTDEPNF